MTLKSFLLSTRSRKGGILLMTTDSEDDDRRALQSPKRKSVHPRHQAFPKICDLKGQFQ